MKIAVILFLCMSGPGRLFAQDPGERPREVLDAALAYAEPLWDERVGLLWSPNAVRETPARVHRVRESGWYALGLLQRDRPGDAARAVKIFHTVLGQQVLAPGKRWHGVFYRYPEEPEIPDTAIAWDQYDPNWRQFVGTTLALALVAHEAKLPVELRTRMLTAIGRAADGEQGDGRLNPTYTNIALMHAYLCAFAGERLQRADLAKVGADYAEAVRAVFAEHGTFEEYNSPTYYGVDFYGLALWRAHGTTERMRSLGAELEAALWRDMATFYHAGLRNLCGPFDRTYGLDMRRYVSLAGLWLRLVLPEDVAPFPPLGGPKDHVHDFFFAPCFTQLGARVPPEVMTSFQRFSGESFLKRTLPGGRIVTAWLGENAMIGGEVTGRTRDVGRPRNQFTPATIHWRATPDTVGWISLKSAPRVDARAEANRLAIDATGDCTFRIQAPGVQPGSVTRDRWTLPGLTVTVTSDALEFSATAGDGYVDATYRQGAHHELKTR